MTKLKRNVKRSFLNNEADIYDYVKFCKKFTHFVRGNAIEFDTSQGHITSNHIDAEEIHLDKNCIDTF